MLYFSEIANKFLLTLGVILFVTDRVAKDYFVTRGGICNTGIAFGIHIHHHILAIGVVVCILYIVFWIANTVLIRDFKEIGVVSCIFFAVLSNGLDRVVYGCVVDYLYITRHFLWFNIADVVIFIGVGMLMWNYFQENVSNFANILYNKNKK